MINAKKELLEILDKKSKIKCAYISKEGMFSSKTINPPIVLKLSYIDEEYQEFINSLNFSYDNGFGGQKLYGIVWLEDNTWLTRGEYDGSEWWEYNILPEIRKECYRAIDNYPINDNDLMDARDDEDSMNNLYSDDLPF